MCGVLQHGKGASHLAWCELVCVVKCTSIVCITDTMVIQSVCNTLCLQMFPGPIIPFIVHGGKFNGDAQCLPCGHAETRLCSADCVLIIFMDFKYG
jgi:hypothetical protein